MAVGKVNVEGKSNLDGFTVMVTGPGEYQSDAILYAGDNLTIHLYSKSPGVSGAFTLAVMDVKSGKMISQTEIVPSLIGMPAMYINGDQIDIISISSGNSSSQAAYSYASVNLTTGAIVTTGRVQMGNPFGQPNIRVVAFAGESTYLVMWVDDYKSGSSASGIMYVYDKSTRALLYQRAVNFALSSDGPSVVEIYGEDIEYYYGRMHTSGIYATASFFKIKKVDGSYQKISGGLNAFNLNVTYGTVKGIFLYLFEVNTTTVYKVSINDFSAVVTKKITGMKQLGYNPLDGKFYAFLDGLYLLNEQDLSVTKLENPAKESEFDRIGTPTRLEGYTGMALPSNYSRVIRSGVTVQRKIFHMSGTILVVQTKKLK